MRLLNAFVLTCDEIIENEDGSIKELRCSIERETLGGKKPADGKKVKGFMHWLSADTAKDAMVRVYDRLFKTPNPGAAEDWRTELNPNSLKVYANAKVEPALAQAQPEDRFQFTRMGYYVADRFDYNPEDNLVFNCIVPLRQHLG